MHPLLPRRSLFLLARLVAPVGAILALGGCATMPAEDAASAAERYRTVIASPVRTDQDRRMDASRHPAQFLPFTQVKPGMQVLDVAAGGGYTSQLLALAVGANGRVWAQSPAPGRRSPNGSPTSRRPISWSSSGRSTIRCPTRRPGWT